MQAASRGTCAAGTRPVHNTQAARTWSLARKDAPASRSARTQSAWPHRHARMRGVKPSALTASLFAPKASKLSMQARWPYAAARCRAVLPACEGGAERRLKPAFGAEQVRRLTFVVASTSKPPSTSCTSEMAAALPSAAATWMQLRPPCTGVGVQCRQCFDSAPCRASASPPPAPEGSPHPLPRGKPRAPEWLSPSPCFPAPLPGR